MKQRHLYPALLFASLGLAPSIGCSGASESTARSSHSVAEACIYFPETGHSVCDDDHGRFKSTFERFGLAAIGYPLTDAYPDGEGDWYQAFERVDMNGNFGQGCEEGRACVAHLGRWDLENVQEWIIGGKVSDCNSDAVGERVNELCMPFDFLDQNYYRNGQLEFYGHMLTRVYDNCPLYPNGVLGQCFWTERAKVGRIYGRSDWEGEQLGRKKLELEGPRNSGPPPPPPPGPATDPRMNLSPTTIYLPRSTPGVSNYKSGGGVVTVCRQGTDPALIQQLQKFLPGGELVNQKPSVIVETGSDTWESRKGIDVTGYELVIGCPNSEGYNVYLTSEDYSWLQDFDVAGSFNQTFGLANIKCREGIEIDEFSLDVKRFPIKDGKLQKPALVFTIGGKPLYENTLVNCSWEQRSPTLLTQVGIVPIVYDLYFSVGLSMKVSKGSRWQATLGTEDGVSFWVEDDPAAGTSFVLTPKVRLGVRFYRTISAYAGLDLPITATAIPNCTNEYRVAGQIVAGASLGVPGLDSTLQAEWSSEPLFDKVIRPARCN